MAATTTNTKTKKIVLFDFDGVMVDTFPLALGIAKKLSQVSTPAEYRKMFEGNIYDFLKNDRPELNNQNHQDDWFSLYRPGLLKLPLVKKIKSVLRRLAQKYLLIIISSTISSPIKEYANLHDISRYFTEVFGADVHKSKIEKINMVFKKYQAKPKDCVFITDTLGDIREATHAGVKSLAVTYGFHNKKTLEKGSPIAFIESPDKIPQAVDQYFAK